MNDDAEGHHDMLDPAAWAAAHAGDPADFDLLGDLAFVNEEDMELHQENMEGGFPAEDNNMQVDQQHPPHEEMQDFPAENDMQEEGDAEEVQQIQIPPQLIPEINLQGSVQQKAQQAVDMISQEMDAQSMAPAARARIIAYAELCRRAQMLVLTAEQREILSTIPYRPTSHHNHQGQEPTPPGTDWSRDLCDNGSQRYINRILALQQIGMSHVVVAASNLPNKNLTAAYALRWHTAEISPENIGEDSEFVLERPTMLGWKLPVASYSASALPRTLEDKATEQVLVGASVTDGLRLAKSFNVVM